MKKARDRSTICTEFGLCLTLAMMPLMAGTARAEMPVNGCYVHDYDAAHLAAHPGQGVAALRLWFHDEVPGQTAHRAVAVEALMADQGQGARDRVGGLTLTQYAYCDTAGICGVECDGGFLAVTAGDTDITVTTSLFVIGNADVCGGVSDLAETEGAPTQYVLAAASIDACETLWRQHPLPEPGCWGADYSTETGGVMALRLRIDTPDPDLGAAAFSMLSGALGATLPETGRAVEQAMGGARVSQPIWCSTFDGTCRARAGDGWFSVDMTRDGPQITVPSFTLFGRGARQYDMAAAGSAPITHLLRALSPTQCRGL